MKCEECNTRFRLKFVHTTVDVDGRKVHFDNIPAWVCGCNRAPHLPEETLVKAKYFARVTANKRLDYEQCEDLFESHVLHDAVMG